MREMRVLTMGLDPLHDEPVLLLQETADQRRILPVWVGMPEATAIEMERRHIPTRRPTTHHLIGQIIETFAHHVEQVRITTLRDGTFHAELVLDGDIRISARPTDGIVLALHLGVPILAADTVLDQASYSEARLIDNDEPAAEARREEPHGDEAAEIERFRHFIDDASAEDFGRP
jgi:bifunctional DNase/RNase